MCFKWIQQLVDLPAQLTKTGPGEGDNVRSGYFFFVATNITLLSAHFHFCCPQQTDSLHSSSSAPYLFFSERQDPSFMIPFVKNIYMCVCVCVYVCVRVCTRVCVRFLGEGAQRSWTVLHVISNKSNFSLSAALFLNLSLHSTSPPFLPALPRFPSFCSVSSS